MGKGGERGLVSYKYFEVAFGGRTGRAENESVPRFYTDAPSYRSALMRLMNAGPSERDAGRAESRNDGGLQPGPGRGPKVKAPSESHRPVLAPYIRYILALFKRRMPRVNERRKAAWISMDRYARKSSSGNKTRGKGGVSYLFAPDFIFVVTMSADFLLFPAFSSLFFPFNSAISSRLKKTKRKEETGMHGLLRGRQLISTISYGETARYRDKKLDRGLLTAFQA